MTTRMSLQGRADAAVGLEWRGAAAADPCKELEELRHPDALFLLGTPT